MGVGPSADNPRWDRQYSQTNPLPANWDEWGYVPYGSSPSQHVWSEWYRDGAPPAKPLKDGSYPVVFGNSDDVMQNFGKFQLSNKTLDFGWGGAPATLPQFFASTGAANYSPLEDATRCTPLTFPDCSMQNAAASNLTTITEYKNNVAAFPNITFGGAGRIQKPMQRWQNVVGDMYQKYESNGFDYVYEINKQDTSSYDPCDQPTLFEEMVPLVIAASGTFALARYGTPFFNDLFPSTVQPVALTSTFIGLFEYGRAAVNVILNPKLHHSSMQKSAAAFSMGVAYTMGAVGGDYYNNNIAFNPFPAYEPLGGATAVYLLTPLIQPKLAAILTVSSFGGIVLGLATAIISGWSRFWCGLNNYGADACEDSAKFPDARRWDVASLCARLTDYACDSEGWAKSDPRAEFVFRSLMTQFDWQFAGNATPSAGNTMYEKMQGTNPVGGLVQGQTTEAEYGTSNPQNGSFELQFTDTIYSTSGDTMGATWSGISSDNSYFACQSFDRLFCNNNESGACTQGGDTAETMAFAGKMREWLDAAINKAYDPNNLEKMSHIPGWSNKKTRFDYDIETYLATCNKDFDETTGTGFNDVRSRGEWAQDCDLTKVADGVQKTTVLANSFFAEKSLTDAMNAVLQAKWNDQNMIAWAHYIYYRKGLFQTDDFDRWCGEGDARVDLLWKEPNHGFSAHPHEAGRFEKLLPLLQTLPMRTAMPKEFKDLGPTELSLQAPFRDLGPTPTILEGPFKNLGPTELSHQTPFTSLMFRETPVQGGDWSKWRSLCETLEHLMKTQGASAAVAYYNDNKNQGITFSAFNYCECSTDDAGIFTVVFSLSAISPVSQAFYEWYTCFQTGQEPVQPPWGACGNTVSKELSDAYLQFGAETWAADSSIFAQLLPEQQTLVQQWLGESGGLTQPFKVFGFDKTALQKPFEQTALQQPFRSNNIFMQTTPATGGDWQTWHNFVTQLLYIYQQQGVYYAREYYANNKTDGIKWEHLNLCEISAADDGIRNAMRAIMEIGDPTNAVGSWWDSYESGQAPYAPAWFLCSQHPNMEPAVPQEYRNAYTFNAAQTFIANSNFYEQLSAQDQQLITNFLNRGD